MSTTDLTTVSPSRVRIRRRVVCVAGCCGPKLSVQRYSLSAPSGAATWASSNGILGPLGGPAPSTFGAGDRDEVVALAAAPQRVILAQREAGELLRHQDAPQIG